MEWAALEGAEMLITGGAQKQQDNSYKYGCLNVDGTDGVGG